MKKIYETLLVIDENKFFKGKQIAKEIQSQSSHTYGYLSKLQKHKLIIRGELDMYEITPLGKKIARAIRELQEVNFLR